jgi:hypothetical protein
MRLPSLLVVALVAASTPTRAPAAVGAEGRFLYANDDDWDWASPARANAPSALAKDYGAMSWSALDWMTEGLPRVRGLAVGTLPDDRLTVEQLGKLRGEAWAQIPPVAGAIAGALASDQPPTVILMMHDLSYQAAPELAREDAAALASFVTRGGRLIVLDDWGLYGPVVGALTGVPVKPRAAIAAPDPITSRQPQRASDDGPPRGMPGPRMPVDTVAGGEVTDAMIEALVAQFSRRGAVASTASIVRNGQHTPGLALRVRFTSGPTIAR